MSEAAAAAGTGLQGADNIPLDQAQIAAEKLLQEQAVVVLNQRVQSQERALEMSPEAIKERAVASGRENLASTGGTMAQENFKLKKKRTWKEMFFGEE